MYFNFQKYIKSSIWFLVLQFSEPASRVESVYQEEEHHKGVVQPVLEYAVFVSSL